MVSPIVRMKAISPDRWTIFRAKRTVHRDIGAWGSFRGLCHVLVVETDKVWALGFGLIHGRLSPRTTALHNINLAHWGWSKAETTSLFRGIQSRVVQYMSTHML